MAQRKSRKSALGELPARASATCRETLSAEGQHRLFEQLAREAGCDEDEAAFVAKLKQVASAPPPPPLAEKLLKPAAALKAKLPR